MVKEPKTNLYNAITGDVIGEVSSQGLDFAAILEYGRQTGARTLRKMTFQERGRMLKAFGVAFNDEKKKSIIRFLLGQVQQK
jgi:oxepin-CoA hydrolase / 3-oxo-5,6-dehydrosuberyl-CoA semialdehyde dehydrogenase